MEASKLKLILGVVTIIVLVGLFLALHFYPSMPRTFSGWAVLFFLGIPVYLFFEWLGSYVLNSGFFKRRSSVTRVLIGVPVLLTLVFIAMYVVPWVHQSIEAVGG